LAGFSKQTHLHVVGDDATWIADQVDDKFGSQANYLLDFYHVCDYLAEAAKSCANEGNNTWSKTQQNLLKNNEYQSVLHNLEPFLESEQVDDNKEPVPVRRCYRYLYNRTEQLDYKTAIEKELPIGSGEIESAHRYVIQKRLKLP
jgi:hypothetical protein